MKFAGILLAAAVCSAVPKGEPCGGAYPGAPECDEGLSCYFKPMSPPGGQGTCVTNDQIRAAEIDRINNMEGVLWKAGVNPRFKGQPLGASKSLCGLKEGWKERIAKLPKAEEDPLEAGFGGIPTDFDAVKRFRKCSKLIGVIRDQSNCGCCWAFGAASAASDRLCIATNGTVMVPLSAQELCFCSSYDGCNGGYVEEGWDYIQETGLVTGGQYNASGPFKGGWCSAFSLPHCHHHGPEGHGGDPYPSEGEPGCPSFNSPNCPTKCDSSAVAPHKNFALDRYTFEGSVVQYYASTRAATVRKIQNTLRLKGPVEAAFDVYEDFENYVGGIYHHTPGSPLLGGHAIRITGWGTENGVDYWKIANSWNEYWGEEGYFRIKRGTDECGIESQVVASNPKAKWKKMGENGELLDLPINYEVAEA